MEYVFMDLDGTITNPAEGITNCFEYALNHFGIEVEDKADLEQFIGPPLRQSFKEGFGFDDEQATQAIAKYRERFLPIGMYENVVYEGLEDHSSFFAKRGYSHSWGCNCFDMRRDLKDFTAVPFVTEGITYSWAVPEDMEAVAEESAE